MWLLRRVIRVTNIDHPPQQGHHNRGTTKGECDTDLGSAAIERSMDNTDV